MILIGRCFGFGIALFYCLIMFFLPTINSFQTKSILFDTFFNINPPPFPWKKKPTPLLRFSKKKACLSYSPVVKKHLKNLFLPDIFWGQKLWHIDNAHKGGATSVPRTKHRNLVLFFWCSWIRMMFFSFWGGACAIRFTGLPEKAGQSVFFVGLSFDGLRFFFLSHQTN